MTCGCGCGAPTPLATRNRANLGHVKGQPLPFLRGHRPGVPGRPMVVEQDRGHETACHIWTGSTVGGGYGRQSASGGRRLAHVIAWERAHGPVPEGMRLDHLCRVRVCCNPDHLEPVTHAENCRRGSATKLTMAQARKIKRGASSAAQAAAVFGVSTRTVLDIRSGRRWRDA